MGPALTIGATGPTSQPTGLVTSSPQHRNHSFARGEEEAGAGLGSQGPELEHWGTRRGWPCQCVPQKFRNVFTQMASGSVQVWCFFLLVKLGSGEDQETFLVGKGCTTIELH